MGLFALVGITALIGCAAIVGVIVRIVRIKRLGGFPEWVGSIAGILVVLPYVAVVALATWSCPPHACTGPQGIIWAAPLFAIPIVWIGIIVLALVYWTGEPRPERPPPKPPEP